MTDIFDSAINHHQELARTWDGRYQSGSFARRAEFFRERVLLSVNVAGHWLDAGCGSGYFSRILAELGANVHGVDGASEMVLAAQAIAADHPAQDRLSFEPVETVEYLQFEDASFDGVLSLSVLEYVPQPELALAEMARVLRPEGSLVISVPYSGSLIRAAGGLRHRLRRGQAGASAYLDSSHFTLRKRDIQPLLSRHGLKLSGVYPCDPSLGGMLALISPNLFFIVAKRI